MTLPITSEFSKIIIKTGLIESKSDINWFLKCINQNDYEKELYQKLKFERFSKVLSSLPEKNRRAILLRKLYCLSHKEIAKKMDVSVSSVEKYIATGLKICKQSLCAQGYEANELENPIHLNQSSDERKQ